MTLDSAFVIDMTVVNYVKRIRFLVTSDKLKMGNIIFDDNNRLSNIDFYVDITQANIMLSSDVG